MIPDTSKVGYFTRMITFNRPALSLWMIEEYEKITWPGSQNRSSEAE